MEKYCGRCGKKLNKRTGKCTKCHQQSLRQDKNKFLLKMISGVILTIFILGCVICGLLYFHIIDIPVLADKNRDWDTSDSLDGSFYNLPGEFSSIIVKDGFDAIEVAKEAAMILEFDNAANELVVKDVAKVDEYVYYRLNQMYSGIPVYGRTMVVITDDKGKVNGFTSNGCDVYIENDLIPDVSLDKAKEYVMDYLKKKYRNSSVEVRINPKKMLSIYTLSGDTALLVYNFVADVDGVSYEIIVDADDEKVIKCIQRNYTQIVEGIGENNNGKKITFNVNSLKEGIYLLEDLKRNIRIYNSNNKKISIGDDFFYVVDSNGNHYISDGTNWIDKNSNKVTVNSEKLQGSWEIIAKDGKVIDKNAYLMLDLYSGNDEANIVQSNTTEFRDADAITLIDGVQTTYDFFNSILKRVGFDNNNGSMSVVYNNTGGAYSSDIAIDNPVALLVFGTNDVLDIDLVAHEYMHSVERTISEMIYESESGAIMEAYSDVFGEIVEDYADGRLDGNCDWLHEAFVELGYDHSRSLSDPNDTGNPARVGEDTRTFIQKMLVNEKEVHHYSTIISHAAYLMNNSTLVGSDLSIKDLSSLWYHTLFTLPTNCTFIELREHMEMSATRIGLSLAKIQRMKAAFDEVGIIGQNEKEEFNTNFELKVYGSNGELYDNYKASIVGEEFTGWFQLGWIKNKYKKSFEIKDSKPVTLELPKGNYTITILDLKDNNKNEPVKKTIKIRPDSENEVLTLRTLFGENETIDQNNESKENIPVNAVQFNGHYYYLYTGGIASTYEEAMKYCNDKGGYLATLTSKEENDFVYSYIKQQNCQSAYFGLYEDGIEGNWKWSTGENVFYTNWSYGEPNNENNTEKYGMFYYKYGDGYWNDGDFGISRTDGGKDFICEWGEYSLEQQKVSNERNIALVLDVSGSMSGAPLDETKKASNNFINTILEEDASIGLIAYDDQAEYISSFSNSKTLLQSAVTGLSSGGSTNIEDGLSKAANMLNSTTAKKKIIVLMSDGEPNTGREGEELIAYANEIKEQGILIYTLGFFESLGQKSSAQQLMGGIASDGCHYEVASADDLVFFFEDMADQINGQKYIYVRIACPVDVSVTYDGQTLSSSENELNLRTEFGTLTFEESEERSSENVDDRIKVLRLKEGVDYDIQINGTGYGLMNYTIGFMDEEGNYDDFRTFENIKITRRTKIDTVAAVSSESILNIDEDGDGKYDLKLKAEANGYGEEVKIPEWIFIVIGLAVIMTIIDIFILIILKKRKNKRRKADN